MTHTPGGEQEAIVCLALLCYTLPCLLLILIRYNAFEGESR
jgi:hypothetical protein